MRSMISEASRDMCLMYLFKEYVKLDVLLKKKNPTQIQGGVRHRFLCPEQKQSLWTPAKTLYMRQDAKLQSIMNTKGKSYKKYFASLNLFQILSFNHL